MATDEGLPVQDANYKTLRDRLLKDDQVLEIPSSSGKEEI